MTTQRQTSTTTAEKPTTYEREHTMSTPTQTEPPVRHRTGALERGRGTAYRVGTEDVRAVSFARLAGTELRKLVDTRAGRWLLISILLLTAVAMGAALWMDRDTGSDMGTLLVVANIPQAVLIPILGIMTAANEWSQRTALITFTQEPRRLRVMAAKTVAALLLGLAVLVVSSAVAGAAHAVSTTLAGGGEIDVWLGWPSVVHLVILQTLGVLMGVAFGALFLNVSLGIVAYFLVPTLSPLILLTTAWLRENAGWLDLSTAQGALMQQDWMTTEQWAQIGTTSAIWILLPLAVGCWRVLRKEVK